jgi:hypothetical protein
MPLIRPLGRRPQTSTPLASLALVLALTACSKKGDEGPAAGSGADAAPTTMAPDGGFGFTPGGDGMQAQNGGTGGIPGVTGAYPCLGTPDGTCAGQLYKGRSLPTDIFVMFDQSGSMLQKDDNGITRIDAVRNAVDQFVHAPESAGLGIGIGYFGYHPLMCACTSCNPTDYATPKVTIGTLPEQATAIMNSLKGIEPTGETPTGAAIRGACMYARTQKTAQPDHNVVILLVTDGEPEAPLTSKTGSCVPTLDDAVAAATECAASGLPTYVLGVGKSLDNLNKIAAAGQTTHAYLVASSGTADIVQKLGNIRTDAMIPCAMQLPEAGPGQTIDPQKVNVVYADATCKASTFTYVESAAKCSGQKSGWYYDDPAAPKQINLCAPTCEQVRAAGGQLQVSVGCMTQVIQ